jgi:hypothetical protein
MTAAAARALVRRHIRDRLVAKRARNRGGSPFDPDEPVTIRWANAHDAPLLARLAALDDAAVPAGPMLVAEVEGELRAAFALIGRVAIANPFRPTAELVCLLRLRAGQIGDGEGQEGRASRAGPRISDAASQTNSAGS